MGRNRRSGYSMGRNGRTHPFLGTLWAEMGTLLKWEVPRSTWGQMGQKWAHSAFVGTLWAEMGALLKWEVPRST